MSNYNLVEGPWGENFTFRKIRPEDTDKVIQHIKDYFLRDEPTSAILGYTDEYGEEFEVIAKKLLKDDLSFWVEENKTGDVAAVRVTFRHTKDTNFDGVKMNSKTMKELCRIVNVCHERFDLFDYYNLEEYGDFFVASCAPKYRQLGITTEMYRRSLKFLAAEGFKMAKSVFTSPYTRAAARSLGFEEVYKLDYKDIMDEEGNPVFDAKTLTDEHYASMMCKRL